MNVENKVTPNQEQIEGFFEPGPEGPIYMLNLLKFKENAVYEDGVESELSGAEAYALYAAEVSKILITLGGGGMFNAKVERLVLGDVEELWDTIAIAMYPSRQAMIAMRILRRCGAAGLPRSDAARARAGRGRRGRPVRAV